MLQIAVEQTFLAPVNDVPEVWTVVFAALDGQRTVVREIASEKSHAVMVMATQNNVIVPALGISQDVATDVWLAFDDLRRPPSILSRSRSDVAGCRPGRSSARIPRRAMVSGAPRQPAVAGCPRPRTLAGSPHHARGFIRAVPRLGSARADTGRD